MLVDLLIATLVLHSLIASAATIPNQGDITSNPDPNWANSLLKSDWKTSELKPNSTSLTSTSPFTSNALLTLAFAAPVKCHTNPPVQPPEYAFIKDIDYYKALESIIVADDALEMRRRAFSARNPQSLTQGPCEIGVGMKPTALFRHVEIQDIAIAHLATRIAKNCPWSGGTLGGYVLFGPNREFVVMLVGGNTAVDVA